MRQMKQKVVLMMALGVVLAGCTAPGPVKVYEGTVRRQAELALISVPEQIEVMAIDGREPPPSFLKSRVVLALLPGEHVFSLRYVELFQITADEHDVVRSRQAALRFTAVAGSEYTLEVPKQANRDAARKFAKDPQFQLRNSRDGSVTDSAAIKSYAEASLIDTISKAFEANSGGAQAVTNLDLLKDVWVRATPEERNTFRTWLDQQGK